LLGIISTSFSGNPVEMTVHRYISYNG
jgi:hypothetical protein